jgi:galactokinase
MSALHSVPALLSRTPHDWLVSAPGRVNIIGEHVDYCDGFVLPAAISLRTWMSGAHRPDSLIVVETEDGLRAEMTADAIPQAGPEKWANYLRGVLAGCLEAGLTVPGMEVRIASTLPQGGGLASSAALTVAFATLLEAAAGRMLDPDGKARICQEAESRYAGVPSGCMDQLASVHGRAGHALLIDCRSRSVEPVPLHGVSLLIINSGVRHDLADGAYATRRAETEEAAEVLGVPALRDAGEPLLINHAADLSPVLFQRARHVIGECARTLACAAAMKSGDWPRAGALMNGSHVSLRDDFEVSSPELDLIAAHAQQIPGVHGCRMTGGGFGGCCVALVQTEQAGEAARSLETFCRARLGPGAGVLLTEAADGAAPIVSVPA